MELKIKYSKKFEFERIKYTLKKLDWYTKKGYKPKLPKGITRKSSIKEIKAQIDKEYDVNKYKTAANKLRFDSLSKKVKFFNTLNKYFKKVPNVFVVYLTDYGVGGSYDFPNVVIANINQVNGFRLLTHEITHIIIERKIMKYKVEHWEKERIVDLILNSKEFGFLKYDYFESAEKNEKKYIDKLFNKYFFKDQKMFFEKIKDVRKV